MSITDAEAIDMIKGRVALLRETFKTFLIESECLFIGHGYSNKANTDQMLNLITLFEGASDEALSYLPYDILGAVKLGQVLEAVFTDVTTDVLTKIEKVIASV